LHDGYSELCRRRQVHRRVRDSLGSQRRRRRRHGRVDHIQYAAPVALVLLLLLLTDASVRRRGREPLLRAGYSTVKKDAGKEAAWRVGVITEAVLLPERLPVRAQRQDGGRARRAERVVVARSGEERALGEAERRGGGLEPAGRRRGRRWRRGERAQLGLARQARLCLEPRALPLRRVAEVRGGPVARPGGGGAGAARVGAGLVRDGVDAHLGEALLEVRVPVVLDLIVRALGQVRRDRRPPADCTRARQSFLPFCSVIFTWVRKKNGGRK
jgi:hypothetical protein